MRYSRLVLRRILQRLRIIWAILLRKPVLLNYQMGKVGSSSLAEFCRREGIAEWHTHRFFDTPIHSFNNKNKYLKAIDLWIYKILRLSASEVLVISGVRSPIERNISMYFHSSPLPGQLRGVEEAEALSRLTADFETSFPFSSCANWFDDELNKLLGVDVYSMPFDSQRGFSVYRVGGVKLMIYDISALTFIQDEIGMFLGSSAYKVINRNESSSKEYNDLYKMFVVRYSPKEDKVNGVLSSRYVDHFFSLDDRNSMRDKWLSR
jgi:hypothetical protein